MPDKLSLANLPTPLWRHDALDAIVGCRVWVKRDDMSGGVETGNKARKLEYLLADAQQKGADVLITCGGFQSNHCRATAVLGRGLGMHTIALLRTGDGQPRPLTGNALLCALVGAELRTVTAEQYASRAEVMAQLAESLRASGRHPYVIPEGGSNALGALGYVDAMRELRVQLDAGEADGQPFEVIAHACGSGGTAVGVALGARTYGIADRTWAFAVCEDTAHFDGIADRLIDPVRELAGDELRARCDNAVRPEIIDRWKGPAYAVASDEQLAFITEVGAQTGLVLDNAYTGKALFGLAKHPDKPQRACFIHTGGFPGLFGAAKPLVRTLPQPVPHMT